MRESNPESTAPFQQSPAGTIAESQRSRDKSESEANSTGLKVVYSPEGNRAADIVFVHGLGGTSQSTWSKNKDPELFWPLKFLPLEPEICLARVLTFGYNARFRKAGSANITILDFAKDLLFDLKYRQDDHIEELEMGAVRYSPINPRFAWLIDS